MRLILCEVTKAGINALTDPYAEVSPYATCESAPLLVVQVIVAPDAVIVDVVIPERVTGATSESVAAADVPFNVAVTVPVLAVNGADWFETGVPMVLAVKVAEVALDATLTEDGTVNRNGALFESVTTVLLVVDFDRVTVHVVLALEGRLVAAHCSEDMVDRVASESVAAADEPFSVAVTVAV